ncbi:Zinc finger, C4 type [Aphelenchoides besseyi]|nr:Zinc finger, C4 type [Aphelenchoides besseyi]KAI6194001.1 Zinc finger, C4 type [Aphelenchoides besseyi]
MERQLIEPDNRCLVCGDRSSGRHYGVSCCYGCKGFFRRSIRSNQSYSCRFMQKCSIDKDQRNSCRACRFNRCLQVGMEIEAIRPDRDIIGKQKNPRKRKFRREESCESSPPMPFDSNSSQPEDALLNFLLDIEYRHDPSPFSDVSTTFFGMGIGIANIKPEPDVSLFDLFENRNLLESYRKPMTNDIMRTSSVENLSDAMKHYAISNICWINGLFSLARLENTHEKYAILRSSFAAFSAWQKATNTANMMQDRDALCLCNGALVPRNPPRHLLDTNLLANNLTGRILDELVRPIRKLQLLEAERAAITALILLDGESCGCSLTSSEALAQIRDRVQNALFQFIRERYGNMSLSAASSRFANILLLLPSIAKISAIYNENFALANMFGIQSLDPLLAEILLQNGMQPQQHNASSPSAKIRVDAATQTGQSNQLPELKVDDTLAFDTNVSCMSNSSTASALSSHSTMDEASALDSILALGLEMEERAAQAKAEAQQQLIHRQPKPAPLAMQQPQMGEAFSQQANFYFGNQYPPPFTGFDSHTPPAIPPATGSAGLMPNPPFSEFYDRTSRHSSPQQCTPPIEFKFS